MSRLSRVGDYPRIMFHAPGRMFDRLLKESSLSDLKKTVRTKLCLKSGSVIYLAQLRHGESVDLEDEDDFDAFYSLAYEQRLVAIQVTLADNVTADESAPALEERPRKKHKRKHEVQTMSEQEAESHVENQVSLGKRRKVAFTESPAKTDEPISSPEGPRKKRMKDDGSSIAAVVEPDSESSEALNRKKNTSHDGTKEPKKEKKRKRKSIVDSEADDGVQSYIPSKHQTTLADSDAELEVPPGINGQPSRVFKHSTFNEQGGPIALEVSATRSRRKKQTASTEPSTLGESLGVGVSSTTNALKKKASRRKLDYANEKEAKPAHPPAGDIDDASASSGSPDTAEKARNIGNRDGYVLDYSKGETNNRKHSSTVDANNTTTSNIDSRQTRNTEVVLASAKKSATNSEGVSSTVKKSITTVAKKKKSAVASPSPVNASEGSPDVAPVDAVMNDSTTAPGDAKKRAGPLKASAEASTFCLVCNRTLKHELVDCPIIEEGPASIQKRIKSLRASKRIPNNEKLTLISELQKIKTEQRESGKRKAREAKNVDIGYRSQSVSSPERTKDVGGHANDVAGVSKESRAVNPIASSSAKPSATRPEEAPSLDAGTHPIISAKQVNNNDATSLPDIGDVSGLANFDLDALMKGPETSFLSINNMPSSDDGSEEEEEKMSGENDSDDTEKPTFATLMRDDSSDTANGPSDELDDESVKPVVGSSQLLETDNSSSPKHSEDGDTSDDSVSDVDGGDARTVNAVRDAESSKSTGPSGGQAGVTISAPNGVDSIHISEEQSGGDGTNEELPLPSKGRDESSLAGDFSTGRKDVRFDKNVKKTDSVSLSQVSKKLENSAAHNPKARPKNKLTSNTSNQSAAKKKKAMDMESSSHPDDDEDTLIDELLPSSPFVTRPQPLRNKKASNGSASKDDISEPPNSQPPLALSQKSHLQDPIEDAESNSETETKVRRLTQNSRFPRLSEMRSKSIPKNLSVSRITPSRSQDNAAELYGKRGRVNESESESESSSDSDSEVEEQSHNHFPKTRIAGTVE